ncbi:MAG: SIMPL domain-containing protein [Caldiserica bacterium]|nr:SIMPL domain-containing protein [Caldisericota bacterium]
MKKRFAFVALQSIAIVAIAAVIAFSPAIAARQSVKADTTTTVPTPSVSVTGTGKITVKPTIARISFGVFTHNETANGAQTANDAVMAKITAALKAAGISEDDIQTTSYSLQPRWVWDKTNEKNIQSGYDMNHNVTVTVRAIKDAGKTVSLIADNGANTVDGVSFDVDDTTLEQTKLAALDLAMANARKRADVVAKAAGRTITSVQTVNVNENSYIAYPMYKAADTAVSGAGAAPVEAGTMDILMSVSVTYLF